MILEGWDTLTWDRLKSFIRGHLFRPDLNPNASNYSWLFYVLGSYPWDVGERFMVRVLWSANSWCYSVNYSICFVIWIVTDCVWLSLKGRLWRTGILWSSRLQSSWIHGAESIVLWLNASHSLLSVQGYRWLESLSTWIEVLIYTNMPDVSVRVRPLPVYHLLINSIEGVARVLSNYRNTELARKLVHLLCHMLHIVS